MASALHRTGGQATNDLALEKQHHQEQRCRDRNNRRDGEHHVTLGLRGSKEARDFRNHRLIFLGQQHRRHREIVVRQQE